MKQLKDLRLKAQSNSDDETWTALFRCSSAHLHTLRSHFCVFRLVEQSLTVLMLSHVRLLFTSIYQQRKDLEYRQKCLSDVTGK